MESVDGLREYAPRLDPWPESRDRIEQMADAIEAEVAEKYALLPVGNDGKPIRPGETVCGSDGHEWRVTYIRIGRNHSVRATDGTESKALRPEWLTHEKPPTVEGVLKEFTDAILEWAGKSGTVADTGTWSDVAARYAAKLRLAGGDEPGDTYWYDVLSKAVATKFSLADGGDAS